MAVRASIIIVTWNAAPLIGDVLAALDAQTVRPDRILVVDNGSDDLAQLTETVVRFPACELLALGSNTGFAAANNAGIARCGDSEHIVLLNPDAFPEPRWLEALLAAADTHPQYGSFASRMLDHANDALLDGAGDTLSLAGKPRRRGYGQPASGRYQSPEPVFAACAAAALYRRADLERSGGFDERFFCYVEDVDLGFRLLLQNRPCRYVPDAVVRHMGSALTGRRSDFSIYHGQRNLVGNYVKNMPPLLFWICLPLHLALNAGYLVAAAFTGRGAVMWRAKRDAVRMLPAMWRSRREIQAARQASTWTVLRYLGGRVRP